MGSLMWTHQPHVTTRVTTMSNTMCIVGALMRSLAQQVKRYKDSYTVYPYLLETHSIFTLIIFMCQSIPKMNC